MPSSYSVYTVQSGDSLYSIAKRCNSTAQTVARMNGLRENAGLSIGQTLRVPCAPRPPMMPRPPQEIIYVVKPGDTLGEIAFRFGTTVPVLLRLNELADSELIYPGQELRIPDLLPEGNNVYVVQPGDTLYSIAGARGTTVEELVRLNNIRTPNLIFPGDRLRLP